MMPVDHGINLDTAEILSYLAERDVSHYEKIRVGVLRNITYEPIQPYIDYFFDSLGFIPHYYFSLFDNLMQEAASPDSKLYSFNPDFILIVLDLEMVCPDLIWRYCELSDAQREKNCSFVSGCIGQIVESLQQNLLSATIICHTFMQPNEPALGFYDMQVLHGQINTVRQLNKNIVEYFDNKKNCYVVDLDYLQGKVGYHNFIDKRYWYIGKAPFSQKAYILLAKEYTKILRVQKGLVKKCLILDLDNTLWGGVVGEDGIDGIQLGFDYPGSAYLDFQKGILNLYHRGIMLAICSKNNYSDVKKVFDDHPYMILKEDHFVNIKVNWDSKADNIEQIIKELNIGANSIVFVDDSDFEISLVSSMLPDVTSIQLKGDPVQFVDILYNDGYFDSLSVSREDKNRTQMYQSEQKRSQVKSSFPSLEEFYRSLNINLTIDLADKFATPRIAQLTQRSNQFNLTTKRYTEAEITAMITSDKYDILYASMEDRFGAHGIISVAIVEYSKQIAKIELLLVSCRVIAYNVGTAILDSVIKRAQLRDICYIHGLFIPTDKNSLVSDFYINHGFALNNEVKLEKNAVLYTYNTDACNIVVPEYLNIKNNFLCHLE